jgi:hypothetical protein
MAGSDFADGAKFYLGMLFHDVALSVDYGWRKLEEKNGNEMRMRMRRMARPLVASKATKRAVRTMSVRTVRRLRPSNAASSISARRNVASPIFYQRRITKIDATVILIRKEEILLNWIRERKGLEREYWIER